MSLLGSRWLGCSATSFPGSFCEEGQRGDDSHAGTSLLMVEPVPILITYFSSLHPLAKSQYVRFPPRQQSVPFPTFPLSRYFSTVSLFSSVSIRNTFQCLWKKDLFPDLGLTWLRATWVDVLIIIVVLFAIELRLFSSCR